MAARRSAGLEPGLRHTASSLGLAVPPKHGNLEVAFAMFVAYYNSCWQTRKPGKIAKLRSAAAIMAGWAGQVGSFDVLFEVGLCPVQS